MRSTAGNRRANIKQPGVAVCLHDVRTAVLGTPRTESAHLCKAALLVLQHAPRQFCKGDWDTYVKQRCKAGQLDAGVEAMPCTAQR